MIIVPSVTFDLNDTSGMLDYIIDKKGDGYVFDGLNVDAHDLFDRLAEKIHSEIVRREHDGANSAYAMAELLKARKAETFLKKVAEAMDWCWECD